MSSNSNGDTEYSPQLEFFKYIVFSVAYLLTRTTKYGVLSPEQNNSAKEKSDSPPPPLKKN